MLSDSNLGPSETKKKQFSSVREAFHTKKWGNLGNGPNRGEGGRQKIKKVKTFSWEKFKIRGEGLRKSKKSQVPEGTKD